MSRWLRLYPSWWRERNGEEFEELVAASARRGLWLAVDIGRGALDAHLHRRPDMARTFNDAALRRGVYDGALASVAIAVVAVLTNVVFPPGRNESDGDPQYLLWQLAGFAVLAMLFVAVGARARRRSDTTLAGAKGGAAAGMVVAASVTVTFLIMNNLFLDIVSQQHDKRVAFAASGWSSMRAYLSVTQLKGGLLAIPIGTVVGAALGFFGGVVVPRPQGQSRPLG